jgi:hypothetical protein
MSDEDKKETWRRALQDDGYPNPDLNSDSHSGFDAAQNKVV